MTADACYAGIIVSDLAPAIRWYTKALSCRVAEEGDGWASLELDGGARLELSVGDPARPGLTFPSYGSDPGPAVLPGFSVEEPDEAAVGHTVARSLPDWVVVIAPAGVRVVLTDRECHPERGLVGFRWQTPEPDRTAAFLADLGAAPTVQAADQPAVIPIICIGRAAVVEDPDGNLLELV